MHKWNISLRPPTQGGGLGQRSGGGGTYLSVRQV